MSGEAAHEKGSAMGTARLGQVRLGMVRLTDAAPIVLAQAEGMFAAEGLDAAITVEPSWANVADKLAWGVIDAAVMLQPLAIAMALGLRGPATPLIIPCGISRNGNAITLSRDLAAQALDGPAAQVGQRLRALRPARLRLGVVHAFSTHDLLLRLWLEQAGIDPDKDAEIVVVPPQDAVAALADGSIDGFCAGAPWGGVAAMQGVGRTVAVTSAIVPDHPEKALAVRADWAAAHPAALAALVRAVRRAGSACADPARTASLATLLSQPEWVGVDASLIAASLPGGTPGRSLGDVDVSLFGPQPPDPEAARWLVTEMARWRDMPPDASEIATAMYRPDLFQQAAPPLTDPKARATAPGSGHAPAEGFAPLVPEFSVTSLEPSLAFWCGLLGFHIAYDRPAARFAYLCRGPVQIMLCERNGRWEPGLDQPPFGRGINFQITVDSLAPLLEALSAAAWPLYEPPSEAWYRTGDREGGQREFLVQDPDGYLLRFAESLGERPVTT